VHSFKYFKLAHVMATTEVPHEELVFLEKKRPLRFPICTLEWGAGIVNENNWLSVLLGPKHFVT